MSKNLIKILVMASGVAVASVAGATDGDLKFLGYSQEMINEVNLATGQAGPGKQASDKTELADEVTSVQEQLVELSKTRSLTVDLADRSEGIREEVLSYWQKMSPEASKSMPLSDELKATLTGNIKTALENSGYTIVQLDLVDLPEGSLHNKLRAVIRVAKNIVSRNSYMEIQKNLAEVKLICSEAATIDNFCYLSEMTTFVAENPKNSYYYEKTILRP